METSASGINFKMVVISCMFPEAFMPSVFIQVSSQIALNPAAMAIIALVASTGKNLLSAPTSDTAIVALVHQQEIQYPQAYYKTCEISKPFPGISIRAAIAIRH